MTSTAAEKSRLKASRTTGRALLLEARGGFETLAANIREAGDLSGFPDFTVTFKLIGAHCKIDSDSD